MDSRKALRQTIGLALVVLLMVGCGGGSDEPTAAPESITGQLQGVIIYETTGDPLEAEVSLTECGPESDASDCTISFGASTFETSSDESGIFHFYEIPPGKYALSIGNSRLGPLNVEKENWFVEVYAGKLADLGEVVVSDS